MREIIVAATHFDRRKRKLARDENSAGDCITEHN